MSTLKIKRENGKIFCPLADSWHIETPEEKVRQEYIKILVEDYGYSLDQMAQEIKVNNSQRGQGKARADIVIWKSKQDKIESKAAFIVVECKAENVRIREEDYYQGYNYASWAGASFFVTTNEKENKIGSCFGTGSFAGVCMDGDDLSHYFQPDSLIVCNLKNFYLPAAR